MDGNDVPSRDALVESILQNDISSVESLLRTQPEWIHSPMPRADGGGPLTLAAQTNHLDMVKLILSFGPLDIQQALSRAGMRGHHPVAEYLVEQGANPNGLYSDTATHYGPAILAACETMNPDGIRLMIDLGADPNVKYFTRDGHINSPLGFILGAYVRKPQDKHACLEVLVDAGVPLEDSWLMAFHRGRIDLLEQHVRDDPSLIHRPLYPDDLYRPEIGFEGAAVLTPIEGTTLLHLAMEYDELDIADWLIQQGADANARAESAADLPTGTGHTPMFHAMVACGSPTDKRVRFLLDRGGDVSMRATLLAPKSGWDELAGKVIHQVTPLEYALLFKDAPDWCNRESIVVLTEASQ